jgi:tetratricopeptide (TPR) repeat protein
MTEPRPAFDQAMSRGHSAAWDQQWDQAIAAYAEALKLVPDEPNALASMGFALLQLDRLPEALRCYQRSAMLNPGDPVAPEKCGEIFERQGRLNEAAQTYLAVAEVHLKRRDVQKAIANWERVVRLTPDNLAAHSRLALANERTGRTKGAVLEYIEVARIFQRARDTEKAMAAATRAQQLDPASVEAREALDRLRRGVALPVLERPRPRGGTRPFAAPVEPAAPASGAAANGTDRASSPLTQAVDVAIEQLAQLLFEEDAELSKSVGTVGPLSFGTGRKGGDPVRRAQANKFLGQALSSHTSNDLPAAVKQYESALHAGLDSPLAAFVLGALTLQLGRRADAIKWFKPATGHPEVGIGALFGLGQAQHLQGQHREAFDSLLEALKRVDQQSIDPKRRNNLDETYESLAEDLRRATPETLSPLVGGMLQFLSGEGWEERVQQARRQLDAASPDGQVTPLAELLTVAGASEMVDSLRRVETYIGQGLWGTAMEEAFFALAQSPNHLPVHVRMAEILTAENKVQAAIDKYAVVAETYRARGELGRATRVMQQVLRLSPLDVSMRSWLIEMLVEQGHITEALQQFVDLADTYYQLADLESARTTYGDALILAEQNNAGPEWKVRLLHKMGDIDLQRLHWREAQTIYEQIRNLAPDDHSARATLIDLLFRLGQQRQALAEVDGYVRQLLASGSVDQAITLLEETLESQPDEATLIARLARLYQDTGRRPEAITLYDQLGELQLQSGQMAQAAETIRTILTLQPDDPGAYQRLLEELQT